MDMTNNCWRLGFSSQYPAGYNVTMFASRARWFRCFMVQKMWVDTVDWQNPAPVDRLFVPLFAGFYTSQVVQDFFHQQYYGEGSLTKSKELFVTNFDSRVVKGYNLSWYSMVPVYVVVYRFSIMLHSTESHSIMTSRLRRNSDHFWSRIFKQWRWWRWWPWNCPYWTSERFGDSERKEEERWVEDLFEDFGEHLSPIGWFICIWNNLSSTNYF